MKTKHLEIAEKLRAIVMFGPPTDFSGMKPGTFYQVTLDPNMVSPSGRYIRFDQTFQGGEMHGWQSIDGITVCEILGKAEEYEKIPDGYSIEDTPITLLEIDYGADDLS